MSNFNWNNILELPPSALTGGKRLPKTVLIEQAGLTKSEQKVLNKIGCIEHFATVQKSTTRIPPFIDATQNIQSIVFLRCETRESKAYGEISRLLHKCFPNPTVILFEGIGDICISIAKTRNSLSEKGEIVVDTIETTSPMNPHAIEIIPFFHSLSFKNLPQENLMIYLEEMMWNINLSHTIESIGFFPKCPIHRRAELNKRLEIQIDINKEVERLSDLRRANKNLTLNESAQLRIKEHHLKQELINAIDSVKEICSD